VCGFETVFQRALVQLERLKKAGWWREACRQGVADEEIVVGRGV